MTETNRSSEQLAAEKRAKTDKRRYVALQLRGSGPKCVIEAADLESYLFDEPDLVPTDVWMTVAEFEALSDFEGF